MKIIDKNVLVDFLSKNRNALIVGNGFSMNFDTDFGNLYFRLPDSHVDLNVFGDFQISPGAKPSTKATINLGFERVSKKFNAFEQADYENFFNAAIDFAYTLKVNEILKGKILGSKHLNRIEFVPNLYEVAVRIAEVGREQGFYRVNIEDWTVLIWLYYIVKDDCIIQELVKDNVFLELVSLGDSGSDFGNEPTAIVLKYKFNGLTTYFRMLFLSAIFNKGKAIDISLLEKYNEIDFRYFKNISDHFQKVFSLNYDHLIDDIFKTAVTHLHGDFTTRNKKSYFYMNTLFNYRKKRYSTSNILLGDFTLTKRLEPMLHNHVVSKQFNETKLLDIEETIENAVKIKKLNSFVFFGIHPDNDFHIFKSIYDAYVAHPSEEMHVTFCYYNPKEIEAVKEMLLKVLESTGKQILKAAMINIYFVDAKEVIANYKELFK